MTMQKGTVTTSFITIKLKFREKKYFYEFTCS